MEGLLNELPSDKDSYKVTVKTFGKSLKKIPLRSREKLERGEVKRLMFVLSQMVDMWPKHGNEEWVCRETQGLGFTVTFYRKEEG